MQFSLWMRRITGAGMTLLFIVWAYYQRNDADPFIWVTVYACAACFSLFFALDKLATVPAIVFGLVCLAWSLALLTQAEYGSPLITIEAWREGMGLLVIGLWMHAAAYMQKRKQATQPLPTR